MALACDSCHRVITDDTIGSMITVHLPHEKQHPISGQTFLYQVEKIFCNPNCVVVEMMTMATTSHTADAE